MAEARSLKQREYGTDVLSHPDHNVVDYNRSTRYNNTMKSSAFHNEPDRHENQKLTNKRNNFLADKPLTTKVARASYQDSNIFGYKNSENGTVQASAVGQGRPQNQRSSNTFSSQAFGDPVDNRVKGRDQNTFKSGIFGDPVVENKGRQRLGGASSGTSNLFGDDRPDYQRSNHNQMIEAPKAVARPEKAVAAAPDAKARELYGNTATAYGYQKNKRDGALMSSGADWKNTGQTAFNKSSPMKKKNAGIDDGVDTREKKYAQLQSSVFGGGYMEGEKVEFDREAKKNAFGSAADWKTEAGMAKPINAGSTRTDTFRQRQKQLASSVLEQTDNTHHQPISKKAVDIDNAGHQNPARAKGRKTDAEFKQRVGGFEPVKKDYEGYNAGNQKQSNLRSAFDVDRPATASRRTQENPINHQTESYTIPGRDTKATKQAMLASNDLISGQSSMTAYNQASESRMVDLQLRNLPANSDIIGVKKMSGAKHIVGVNLDEDNMKGICLGTGRIQLRVSENQPLDEIELNFAKQGIVAREFENDPRKKPQLTGPPKEFAKEITNTKNRKQEFLSSKQGGIFGAGGSYQVGQ